MGLSEKGIIAADRISHFDPLTLARFVLERGSVEAVKSLDALVSALRQGGAVIIYPEGTTTREPHLWPMRGAR